MKKNQHIFSILLVASSFILLNCGDSSEAPQSKRLQRTVQTNGGNALPQGTPNSVQQTPNGQNKPVDFSFTGQSAGYQNFLPLFIDNPPSDLLRSEERVMPWPQALKELSAKLYAVYPAIKLVDSSFKGFILASLQSSDMNGAFAYTTPFSPTQSDSLLDRQYYIVVNYLLFNDFIEELNTGSFTSQKVGTNNSHYFDYVATLYHEFNHVVDFIYFQESIRTGYIVYPNYLTSQEKESFNQQRSTLRGQIIDLSWILDQNRKQQLADEQSSTMDLISAWVPKTPVSEQYFVDDYAATNIAEDLAETLTIYFTFSRFSKTMPLRLKSASQINKICSMVDTFFNQTNNLGENCQQCMNGGCFFNDHYLTSRTFDLTFESTGVTETTPGFNLTPLSSSARNYTR